MSSSNEANDGVSETPQFPVAELRILLLLPSDLCIKRIAQALFIERGTANARIASIYRKPGADNRASAVARARALGILRFPVE